MIHLPFADTYVNLYAIVLAGVCTGIIGGFFGLSGSFILTPLLNALGFPMTFAVGTNLTHLFGRSVLAAVRNNVFGYASWTLAVIIGATGAGGIHLGKVILLYLEQKGAADTVARVLYMALLFAVGTFMVRDYLQSKKAGHTTNVYARISALAERIHQVQLSPMLYLPNCGGKRISLWFLVVLGAITGLLAGLLGISGSSIRLPALVFLTGLPLLPALCTDALATLISTGLGAAGFTFSGHTETVAAMLLLLASGVGSQIGHVAARHVNRSRMSPTLFAGMALIFTGVILTHLGYHTPAAVLMLASLFAVSAILLLATAGTAIRENRNAAAYSAAAGSAPHEK